MSTQRKILAWTLTFCFFIVESLSAATTFDPYSIRQQAAQLGAGAKVRLKLANGEKLVGSIESIQDNGLRVAAGRNPARLIAYDQIGQLKLASRRYTASGQPDPVAVSRVVMALGVGQHVVVNRPGVRAIHGFIQAIDSDHFTILPDHETAPVKVAYHDVRHVEKNLSLGATIVLVVLIAAALVAGLTIAATR